MKGRKSGNTQAVQMADMKVAKMVVKRGYLMVEPKVCAMAGKLVDLMVLTKESKLD